MTLFSFHVWTVGKRRLLVHEECGGELSFQRGSDLVRFFCRAYVWWQKWMLWRAVILSGIPLNRRVFSQWKTVALTVIRSSNMCRMMGDCSQWVTAQYVVHGRLSSVRSTLTFLYYTFQSEYNVLYNTFIYVTVCFKMIISCVIWSVCCGINEVFALLGCRCNVDWQLGTE